MLSRLPTTIAAMVSAHLSLRDFVRLRQTSHAFKQVSRLGAAHPRAIAVDGPRRFCAAGPPLELPAPFSTSSVAADFDPRTDPWLDTSDERRLYAFPRGLLALDPTHFSARVDSGRVVQIAAASVDTRVEAARLGQIAALAVGKHTLCDGVRIGKPPSLPTTGGSPDAQRAPRPQPVPCLGKSLRHLVLRLQLQLVGKHAVRSLAPLEALSRLETLELHVISPYDRGFSPLPTVWPRLPELTRFRIASGAQLMYQSELDSIAHAFPALTDLGDVYAGMSSTGSAAAVDLPAFVPHIRTLKCDLVTRPNNAVAIAPLPPQLERLEVHITDMGGGTLLAAPRQPFAPLLALVAYQCLATLHVRVGFGGPRQATSLDPFALLCALPALRQLEIVADASVSELAPSVGAAISAAVGVFQAAESDMVRMLEAMRHNLADVAAAERRWARVTVADTDFAEGKCAIVDGGRGDPSPVAHETKKQLLDQALADCEPPQHKSLFPDLVAPTSSPVGLLRSPLPPVSLLRSLVIVCLHARARVKLPVTRFPHLASLRIVAAECDLAPFCVPATAHIDRALESAACRLTE